MPHDDHVAATAATEQTPLLGARDVAPTADALVSEATALQPSTSADPRKDDDQDDDVPLPRQQVLWLCFARLVEPMAFFSIFPYINQMTQQNGNLDDVDVGFYSGLIESLFSLTQAIVMIFWGRAADTFGRKPVLVSSLAGIMVATSIFGLAKTIWQMILFRCIAGVFAGTIVTIRTMLTEVSTPRTQVIAFSWFAFSGNMGILLGPVIGGALADPAHQYSRAFGSIQFLHDYPYALSSFVIAGIGLVAFVTSAVFVDETLPKEPAPDDGAALPPNDRHMSIAELVKAPGVGTVLYVYAHIFLLAFAYTAIIPLFFFTPVALGGVGLAPYQISIMMAVNGAAQALWLLVAFPLLQRRWGTNALLRGCAIAYPFFFATVPLGSLILRAGGAGSRIAFWIMAPLLLALGSGVAMSFTAIQLALNDVSPDPRVLGTLNSIALTGVSLLRAVAPAAFASLFALGARSQLLWGYAIWVLMIAMALGFTVVARWLPEKRPVASGRRGDGDASRQVRERDGDGDGDEARR